MRLYISGRLTETRHLMRRSMLLTEIGCDAPTEVGQAISKKQLVGQVRKEGFSDWDESSCI